APTRRNLAVLEPPEHDVADPDEEEHEAESVRRAVIQHAPYRDAEPDAAEEHTLTQVRPRGAAADLLALLVDGCGRRRRRHGCRRVAGERAQRLRGRHDALFG